MLTLGLADTERVVSDLAERIRSADRRAQSTVTDETSDATQREASRAWLQIWSPRIRAMLCERFGSVASRLSAVEGRLDEIDDYALQGRVLEQFGRTVAEEAEALGDVVDDLREASLEHSNVAEVEDDLATLRDGFDELAGRVNRHADALTGVDDVASGGLYAVGRALEWWQHHEEHCREAMGLDEL